MRILLALMAALTLCSFQSCGQPSHIVTKEIKIATGADRTERYFGMLIGKRVAVVANQTSRIGETHLVDTLLSKGIQVVRVFAPEHGFRGESGAGETIRDGMDVKTGLPLISLYGKTKKPSAAMLSDVDIIIFDIQDVGTRFYTYISTMHYVMESAAENNKHLIILDRPNPNGFYIDGPVLDPAFSSFVGMHQIPIVHGLTIGELARMIVGEGWLKTSQQLKLDIVPCENYGHSDLYKLPVRPSPNLPDMASVYLYPSLCWFEGTDVSVGRGTPTPFQVIGYPGFVGGEFEFIPTDIDGIAKDPPHEGEKCSGYLLTEFGQSFIIASRELYLEWLIGMYRQYPVKDKFFTSPDFFDHLCGTDQVRMQLIAGKNATDIRKSWQAKLDTYRQMRKKYLLYPDFE